MRNRIVVTVAAILVTALALTACASGSANPAPSTAVSKAATTTVAGNSGDKASTTTAAQGQAINKKISAKEAKALMDTGKYLIVDVRTQDEFNQKRIPGAILVVNELIGKEPPAALPDKNAPLLLYCRSGRRSAEAAVKLAKLGYREIYDFGGINDWPFETVSGSGK